MNMTDVQKITDLYDFRTVYWDDSEAGDEEEILHVSGVVTTIRSDGIVISPNHDDPYLFYYGEIRGLF